MSSRRRLTTAWVASPAGSPASVVVMSVRSPASFGGDLGGAERAVRLHRRLQTGDRLLDLGRVGLAVDDDHDRVRLAEREVAVQRVPPLLGVLGARECAGARGVVAGLHHDDRPGEREQRHDGDREPDHGAAHDAVGEALPDAVVAVEVPGGAATDDRQAQRVDVVAEQAEERRERDERREQRGDDDEHDADAHADHDVERDDDHAGHGEDDGHAAEEDGAVGRGARSRRWRRSWRARGRALRGTG